MRVLILVFCIAVLFSCSKKGEKNTADSLLAVDTTSLQHTDTVKTYLALGDSYTIGQSVKEAERFPAQTVDILKQLGVSVAAPVYIAQTGWTTAELQNAIEIRKPSSNFDAVSLLIGVNDQYRGIDTGTYAQNFSELLSKAVQLAKGKVSNVFVLSIPDYSVTPFVHGGEKPFVSRQIDLFNEINLRITRASGISYIDITPSTKQAATDPTLIAGDSLHPSGFEYIKWAGLLAPKMKLILK